MTPRHSELDKAADVLVLDQMSVAAGEHVLITADTASDIVAADAIRLSAERAGAKAVVTVISQLPYQGSLADPFLPDPIIGAMHNCDVWIDLTLPYMNGSHAHEKVMKEKRVRSVMCAGMDSEGLTRLYGKSSLDRLFAVQQAFDTLIEA